ncbi:metallophosphoesterase 1 homolog [Mizuhopecten yessoensis]|uniref:Metallophosphoesterase 1 n=1 Tax=Mizuhopecten yessoensis TaxID=6573 RepID=A0A210QEJ6_MIZYE|nr:metallophosphoesterase 1 homolog [Mizuhopecten yessoensis]XP_021360083.1 metallophosphoesterase 1 homolog [Mizuhopecten yessoensis]OWF47153.1 Metallophosphoesterase 1 [Mizuhopecten yessoensis]
MARNGPVFFLCGQRWSVNSLTLVIVFLAVFSNEFLIYFIQSFRWPNLPVATRDSSKTQVVLLVADPQIQGYQDEPGFPIGLVTRWDIDRFLGQTFSLAHAYAQPDVVVFLGDLMDEGSKASKEDFKSYYYRFNSIFGAAEKDNKVYIAGDNDIGGEFRDMRKEWKIDRFEKHYDLLTGVDKYGFIDYIKMDIQNQGMQFVPKRELADDLQTKISSPIRVLVSHETIMHKAKVELYPLLRRLKPQLIFSGHWHKSFVFVCEKCMVDDEFTWPFHQRDLTWMTDYMSVNLTINQMALTEIMVPTCSYRMGVANMGYGVAVIESTGEMKYTVLWLPQRYRMLYGYLIVFSPLLLVHLFFNFLPFLLRKLHKRRS